MKDLGSKFWVRREENLRTLNRTNETASQELGERQTGPQKCLQRPAFGLCNLIFSLWVRPRFVDFHHLLHLLRNLKDKVESCDI